MKFHLTNLGSCSRLLPEQFYNRIFHCGDSVKGDYLLILKEMISGELIGSRL